MARIARVPSAVWPADNQASPFDCTIYLIHETSSNNAKIGIASHPIRRRSGLQCGNPRRLVIAALYQGTRTDCRVIEREAREHFRIPDGTEWFIDSIDAAIKFLDGFSE